MKSCISRHPLLSTLCYLIYTQNKLPCPEVQAHRVLQVLCEPCPAGAPHSLDLTLAHQAHALSVVACTLAWLGISGLACRLRSILALAAIDSRKMLLLLCSRDHVGRRVRCPTVDEVTVRAPRRSTRQLAREVTVLSALGLALTSLPVDVC